MPANNLKRNFFLRIVLPTLLAFLLFTITFFTYIIPSFKENMLDSKREMIKELTNSAWSIVNDYHRKTQEDSISKEVAMKEASDRIKNLRYGHENKDYFWITDEQPVMIMHPYLPRLNGSDLSDYADPDGKLLFVEFVKVVKIQQQGFVDYRWQWKDDSDKIVQKLSFVKEFAPWGWIIGTGIYIQDVEDEIEQLTQNILYVSLGILLTLGLILFYIGKQSLEIEHERLEAEHSLRDSESKYRALVEASTDGLVMILNGKIVYTNKALLKILHFDSLNSITAEMIVCPEEHQNLTGVMFFKDLLDGVSVESKSEVELITADKQLVDVILYTSEIEFGEKKGYTVIVKDISASKKVSDELGENKERFKSLINNIDIGVFRARLGRNIIFTDVNDSAVKIFGYDSKEELQKSEVRDLITNTQERKLFFDNLQAKESVKNYVLPITLKNGNSSIISVSAVIIKDEDGRGKFCDALVEDITEKIRIDEERDNLLVELQTSLKFLHQPVVNFVKQIVVNSVNDPVRKVAQNITSHKYSAALIKTENDEYIGIITDRDIRERIVANSLNSDVEVYKVMSAPLAMISSTSLVFEAIIKMHDKATRHLAVRDNQGNITGIISSEELLQVERQSSGYLLREIEIAENIDQLSEIKIKLPRLVKTLVDSGAKTKNITQIITSVFDATVNKLFEFAIREHGLPPVKFAFVALGSAGRKEQTLISDQDNAIIFENVSPAKHDIVKSYFDKVAKTICNGLNSCGYIFCKGEAMANNPKWTQSLDKWKEYFKNWIVTSSQQDLIDISIYFDFRHVYGDQRLAEELRGSLNEYTAGQSGFFQHLTKNCLLHKPPVGILGGLILESKGENAETFDIKMASMPVSDYARIFALKYNLSETNTLERLKILLSKGVINKKSYEEIFQGYTFLMQIRFKHQATQITKNETVNNFIRPADLTQLEINTLKNAFSQIQGMQKRLSFEFSGEAI